MIFCSKCSSPMVEGEKVCSKCGTPVGNINTVAGFTNDKDTIIAKLENFRVLLSECEELKTMIRPQSEFPMSDKNEYRKRSFIKYFWPFLVGAVGGFYAVYMVGVVIIAFSAVNSGTRYASEDAFVNAAMGDTFAAFFCGLIVAAAIIFFGVKVSKRKQHDFNSGADRMNMAVQERYKMGLKNQKMIDIYQDNITQMHLYEHLVPEKYQTSYHVGQLIDVLKEGKAEDLQEAYAVLGWG